MDEARLTQLVQQGATLSQIAASLRRDPSTVRRHIRRLGLQTPRMAVLEANAAARSANESVLLRVCPVHGAVEHRRDARGSYRCPRCNSARVDRRRRRIKEILVEEAGGACALCGYSQCLRALGFHHLDPAEKEFAVARFGHTRSLARARDEVAKCVLLCANCHMEVEAGVTPLHSPPEPDPG